jgi:hypothetical protein
VGLTTLPSSVSRLSRQCGILDISQPYRLPQACYRDSFTFTYYYYYYYYYVSQLRAKCGHLSDLAENTVYNNSSIFACLIVAAIT